MVGESDSDEWRPPPSSFTCMQGQPVPFPVHVHVYIHCHMDMVYNIGPTMLSVYMYVAQLPS